MTGKGANQSSRSESARIRWLKVILGNVLAVACLVWVIYHVHPQQLLNGVKRLRWYMALAAIAIDQSSFLLQAVRWQLLLRPVARIHFKDAVKAVYVGLFTNDVLPMRVGELIRAHMISQEYSVKMSEVVPSIMVERMFEGVWLALGIGLSAIFISLPGYLETGAEAFFGIIVLLVAGFLYFVFREEKALEAGEEPHHKGKVRIFIDEIAIGLRKIGLSAIFMLALGITLVMLTAQAMAVWLVIHAYDLPLPVWEGIVVYLILRVGIVIPSAPGNLGTYQFFVVVGLQLFGIARSIATGFSFVIFVILSGPMWVAGFFAMTRSGLTMFRLRREASDFMEREPMDED